MGEVSEKLENNNSQHWEEAFFLGSILSTEIGKDLWHIQLGLHGQLTMFKINTRADITVIQRRYIIIYHNVHHLNQQQQLRAALGVVDRAN